MLEQRVKHYALKHNLIQKGDGIVVGISGGADSMCLIHVLLSLREQWKLKLYGVHINHGIRAQRANQDEAYVRQFCEQYDIPFYCFKKDIPHISKEQKMSEEEAGRVVRYACFQQVKKETGAHKIAVAHHENDQAETFLLHLCRGSGIQGLTGIRPQRESIIRPLLFVTRKEIEQYLTQKNIAYVQDETNEQTIYARNKMRHKVLPQLEQINERATAHIASACEEMQETVDFLEKIIKQTEQKIVKKQENEKKRQCSVVVTDLEQQDVFLQKQIIKRMIEYSANAKKDLTKKHVEIVLELTKKEVGKEVHLPYDVIAIKQYDCIVIQKRSKNDSLKQKEKRKSKDDKLKQKEKRKSEEEKNKSQQEEKRKVRQETATVSKKEERQSNVYVKKEGTYLFSEAGFRIEVEKRNYFGEEISKKTYTKYFDYDRISSDALFRHRKAGDYVVINEKGEKKLVKRLMIDEKIPRQDRDNILLLADGSHIIWIVGNRMSEYYKVTEETRRVLIVRAIPIIL